MNTSFLWTQDASPDFILDLFRNGSSYFPINHQGASAVFLGIPKIILDFSNQIDSRQIWIFRIVQSVFRVHRGPGAGMGDGFIKNCL